MANDILIVPGSASIHYSGSDDEGIYLQVEASGSLSYQGSGSGQIFGMSWELPTDSGSLMAVTDISGIPVLECFNNNEVTVNGFRGWRPYENKSVHFTCSLSQSGYYFRCGNEITASIANSATIPFALGTEIVFFCTESGDGTRITSSDNGVIINSTSGLNILQFVSKTVKKVGTNEWDMY